MEIKLSKKNCHRALKVRPVENVESSDYTFGYRAISKPMGLFSRIYTHTATDEFGKEIEILDKDLDKWMVSEWKYEVCFEDLYDQAYRAFSGTSHTPEDRALQYIRDYEIEVVEDLLQIPEDSKSEYVKKYREWIVSLFSSHSRIISAMIVGPARFPTARNQKANDAYDNLNNKFRTWREKFIASAKRREYEAKPQEEKDDIEWQAVKRDINRTAGTLYGIEKNHEPYNRTCFVTNLYGRLETLARNGKVEMVKRAANHIKKINEKFKEEKVKPIFTDRHKFWKLVEKAEEQIARQAEIEEMDDTEVEFEGGSIVRNYSENRLQIFHDEKPSQEIINRLKSEGWRWSRANVCWQRQLTRNACYSAARIIKEGSATTDEIREYAQLLCQGVQN